MVKKSGVHTGWVWVPSGVAGFALGIASPWPITDIEFWTITGPICMLMGFVYGLMVLRWRRK